MPKPKKKRKAEPLVCTQYAYRDRKTGLWYSYATGMYSAKTFAAAEFSPERDDVDEDDIEVVPVRCRALTSRKRNPKRTK